MTSLALFAGIALAQSPAAPDAGTLASGKTIYCQYREMAPVMSQTGQKSLMPAYKRFKRGGTAFEVRKQCEALHQECDCSEDPAYFEKTRTCSETDVSCVNNVDCCSARCVKARCVQP